MEMHSGWILPGSSGAYRHHDHLACAISSSRSGGTDQLVKSIAGGDGRPLSQSF